MQTSPIPRRKKLTRNYDATFALLSRQHSSIRLPRSSNSQRIHSSSSCRAMEFWEECEDKATEAPSLSYRQMTRRGIIHDHKLPHGLFEHRPTPFAGLQSLHVDDTVEYYASAFWAMEGGRLAVLRLRNE